MSDSFIVYRNPVEAALWNNVMENPIVIVQVFGFIALTLVMVAVGSGALDAIENKMVKKMNWKTKTALLRVMIVVSVVFCGWLCFFLF